MRGQENFSPIQTPGGELFVPKHVALELEVASAPQALEVANSENVREAATEFNASLKPNEQLGSIFAESSKDKLKAQQSEDRERSLESLHQALSNPDEVAKLSDNTQLLEKALPKAGRSQKAAAELAPQLAGEKLAEDKGIDPATLPENLRKDIEKVARGNEPLKASGPITEQKYNLTLEATPPKPEVPKIPKLDISRVRELVEPAPTPAAGATPRVENAPMATPATEREDIWEIDGEPANAPVLPEAEKAPYATPAAPTQEAAVEAAEEPINPLPELDGLSTEWWDTTHDEPVEKTPAEEPNPVEVDQPEEIAEPTPPEETTPETPIEQPEVIHELPALHDEDDDWWEEPDHDSNPDTIDVDETSAVDAVESDTKGEPLSPGKSLALLWDEYKAGDRSREFLEEHKDELYDQLIAVSNELNHDQVVFEDLDDWEFSKAIELFGDSLHAMYSYSTDEREAKQQKINNDNSIAEITKRWFDAKYPPTNETAVITHEADLDDEDLVDFKPDGATTILPADAAIETNGDSTENDDDDEEFTDFVADNTDDEPAMPTDATTVVPGIDPGLIVEAKPVTEVEKRQRRVGKYLSKIINETGIWNLSRGELSAAYRAGLEGDGSAAVGTMANRAGNILSGAASLVEGQRNRSRNRLYSQVPSSNKPTTSSQEISPEDAKALDEYLSSLPANARAELEKLPREVLAANHKQRQTQNANQKPKPAEQPQSEAERKGLARRALGAAQATRQRNIGR